MKRWLCAAIAASIALCTPTAVLAQKGGKTAPVPEPLVAVDATGKIAGRLLGPNEVVINVSGLLTSVLTAPTPDDQNGWPRVDALRWVPRTGAIFFSAANCSGPPLVTTLSAQYGMRPAVVIIDAAKNVFAYIGSNTAFQLQAYQSRGGYETGCDISYCPMSCYVESGMFPAVPVEAVVNLTSTYPPPLTIR